VRRLKVFLAYWYYAWKGEGWPRWALEGKPWSEVAVRPYLNAATPCWHDRPTRSLPSRVNITNDFKPFWSHNLTPGKDPVYVDSAATKKKLLKKYGLREAGDRQGGAYRTSTSGMGWKKPRYTSTGVEARWGA